MEAALHQDAGAAQRQRFVDLSVDGLERLHVALGRTYGTIESAERAVLRADVCVIDVPVDLISDDVSGMQPPAESVSFQADTDQVVGPEHVESLGVGQSHNEFQSRLCRMSF